MEAAGNPYYSSSTLRRGSPMSNRLLETFAEGLRLSSSVLDDDSTPENTPSWDSLSAMNLVALIEDTFEVELSTREIMKMRSIGIARQVLREKGVQDV